jgi:hypothetical protein
VCHKILIFMARILWRTMRHRMSFLVRHR